jgi:hypothetical protein
VVLLQFCAIVVYFDEYALMERKGDGERSPLGLANVGMSVMMCDECTLCPMPMPCPTRELNPIVVSRIYVHIYSLS